MRTTQSLLFAVMTAAAMTFARAAHAAPPPGKEDVLTEKARDLYVEGEHLYKKGDYGRARAAYLAAWALRKHYQIGHALADCEMKLGLYRDAAEHLAYSIRAATSEGSSSEAEKKLFEEAKAKVGTLEIRVTEPGSVVLVDGAVVGTAPLADPVFVEPGKHTIEARQGAKSARAEVDIGMGAAREVALSPAAPSEEAKGGPATTTPRRTAPPEAGGPDKIILIAGGVTSGVALALGVGFTIGANAKAGDADEIDPSRSCRETEATALSPAQCVAAQDLRESAATLGNVALWSFIGTGAAGAATVAYAVLAPRASEAKAGVRVMPIAGVSGGGLSLIGRF